jgi:hypothetical protein
MIMRGGGIAVALLALSSCLATLLPRQPRTVSAGDSYTAAGYDRAAELLDEVAAQANHHNSKRLRAAADAAAGAQSAAESTLALVGEKKSEGAWVTGVRYRVRDGKVLSEQEILAGLTALRRRAKHEVRRIAAALDAAYRREYPDASEAQIVALHSYGSPTSVAKRSLPPPKQRSAAAHKRKGKRPPPPPPSIALTCWEWNTDELTAETCWKRDGETASHFEKRKPRPEAPEATETADAAPDSADGGGEEPQSSGSAEEPKAEEPNNKQPKDETPRTKSACSSCGGGEDCVAGRCVRYLPTGNSCHPGNDHYMCYPGHACVNDLCQ